MTRLSTPMTFSDFDADEPTADGGSSGGWTPPSEKKPPSGRAITAVGPATRRVAKPDVTARKMSNPGTFSIEPPPGLCHEAFQGEWIFDRIRHGLSIGDAGDPLRAA